MNEAPEAHRKIGAVRRFLDNWRFWAFLWGIAIVGCIVALYFISRDLAEEQASRAAEQKSSAVQQRAECYDAVRTAPDLLSLLETMAEDRTDRIRSNLDALRLDPDSPLADVRRESIRRAREALAGIRRFQERIAANTPTAEECNELSVRLGLQPLDASS